MGVVFFCVFTFSLKYIYAGADGFLYGRFQRVLMPSVNDKMSPHYTDCSGMYEYFLGNLMI